MKLDRDNSKEKETSSILKKRTKKVFIFYSGINIELVGY